MAETLLTTMIAAAPQTAASVGLTAGVASTVGGLVGAASTGFSLLGAIQGGRQQSAMYKIQAKQSELAARTERLRGAEQVSSIRQKMRSTLATQNALFAGRGVMLADGSPASVAAATGNAAGQDIARAQFGADMRASSLESQAQQFQLEADSSEDRGLLDAFEYATKNRNSLRRGVKAIGSLVS